MAPLNYVCPAVALFLVQEEHPVLVNHLPAGLNPVLERREILELGGQDFSALSAALFRAVPVAAQLVLSFPVFVKCHRREALQNSGMETAKTFR